MEKPEISVIVPVYNVGKYLQECIESVIAQSFSEWELLLVDDGSTDGSGAVCDEYAQKDKRIRVFHKENRGVSSARNLGLDNAQGEWIAFLDGDDYFPKETLKILHDEARASKADLVIGSVLHLISRSLYYRDKDLPSNISDITHLPYIRYYIGGYILRRQIIDGHSLRFIVGLAHAEDIVFLSYYTSYCRTMAVVQAPVYVYRMNEASACHSTDTRVKARYWLEASNYLYLLAQSFIGLDEDKYKSTLGLCNYALRRVIYGMLNDGNTRNDFRLLLQCYKETFEGNKERLRFLYTNLPKCYLELKIQHFPRLKKMIKRLQGRPTTPRLYGRVGATEDGQN